MSRTSNGARSFIFNALIIAAVSLVLRLLDTSFWVWLSNRLGPQGVGLYQLITSVYGFAITFSISGLSFAVTRVVSESAAKGKRPFRAAALCALLSLFYSGTAAAALFFFADKIALHLLGDGRAALSLKVFSFALPIIAFGACLRGYFIAAKKALRTVVGDILELFARISAVTCFITFIMPPDIEYSCCAVVIGTLCSEFCAFIYYLISYFYTKRSCTLTQSPPYSGMLRGILRISLPVAFGAYLRSALVTAENLLIPRGLELFGFSSADALTQYGLIKGMTLPVLTFPSAIISAFAMLLVPEVAETNIKGNSERISAMTHKALKATFLYSILAMSVFLFYGKAIGDLIYPQTDAGKYIFILAPIIPLIYVDFVVDSLLKALDKQVTSLKFNTVDAFFRTSLVLFLLPHTGTVGWLLILFAGSSLNAFLSIRKLLNVSGNKLDISRMLLKPALCAMTAAAVCALPFRLAGVSALSVSLSVISPAAVYLLFLLLTKTLERGELSVISSLLPSRRTKQKAYSHN